MNFEEGLETSTYIVEVVAGLFGEIDSVFDNLLVDIQVSQIDILVCELMVKTCFAVVVDREARVTVYLKDPRLVILVNEHIEAQDLERSTSENHFIRNSGHLVLHKGRSDLHDLAKSR